MKISEQFAGNYFKSADLPQPKLLIVQSVSEEKMPEGTSKPVIRFAGEQQSLVLNKTNAYICVELFGDETAAWLGQKIELYSTTTSYSGRMVPCIRIRQPQQQVSQHAVPQVQQQVPQHPVPSQPQPSLQHPSLQAPPADYPVDA